MDKDSQILLEKIDCCCNNCKFMERDIPKFQKSLDLHHRWQFDYFNTIKNKMIKKSEYWRRLGNEKKAGQVLKMAEAMTFQFDRNECLINYGTCTKFAKPVSFIPNVLQLETQECFEHRRN